MLDHELRHYAPELCATYRLLSLAAHLIDHLRADSDPQAPAALETLLDDAVEQECRLWGLPPELAAWWIRREAHFRITVAAGFPVSDRDEDWVPVVLDGLCRQPAREQVRVLREAARLMLPETG